MPSAEPVKNGGVEDRFLNTESDISLWIVSRTSAHQEDNAADLRQLPQELLEQHLTQEAGGSGYEQGLTVEKIGGFSHGLETQFNNTVAAAIPALGNQS
jgi:hypothetical protein